MKPLFTRLFVFFKKRKVNRTGSKDIIKLTSIVVVLFFITILLIFLLSTDMSKYSALINDTGRIRGGIQRLVKLELNNIHDEALIERIDSLLLGAKTLNERRLIKITRNKEYTTLLLILDDKWKGLKSEIAEYNNGGSSSEILIRDSETLWNVSNDVVSSIENISHFNVILYYIVAVISTFGIFSLFLVLFITKYYIRDKIEYLAQHDQLTGLANRHYFNDFFEREYSIAMRSERQFAVFLCDIDHFKMVNDNFGHDTGDKVLKEIAETIKKMSRESDIIARFGGEEFIILSVDNLRESALAFAERIRKSIEEIIFIPNYKITISIGLTLFKKEKSMDELVQEADQALYKAKESGRNKVIVYEGKFH